MGQLTNSALFFSILQHKESFSGSLKRPLHQKFNELSLKLSREIGQSIQSPEGFFWAQPVRLPKCSVLIFALNLLSSCAVLVYCQLVYCGMSIPQFIIVIVSFLSNKMFNFISFQSRELGEVRHNTQNLLLQFNDPLRPTVSFIRRL